MTRDELLAIDIDSLTGRDWIKYLLEKEALDRMGKQHLVLDITKCIDKFVSVPAYEKDDLVKDIMKAITLSRTD